MRGGAARPRTPISPRPLLRRDPQERTADGSPWRVASSIAAQTALLGALYYYFGWVRTQATLGHFGIDVATLGFSPSDYALRGVNSVFQPLVGVGFTVVGLLLLHRWIVVPALRAAPASRTGRLVAKSTHVATIVAVLAALITAVGVVAYDSVGRPLGTALPAGMILSTSLLWYVQHVRTNKMSQRRADRSDQLLSFVLVMLMTVGLLWAIALYATHVGQRVATDFVARMPYAPDILIYSTDRIAIAGTGVTVDEIHQDGSRYHYRYSGLRLLQ
jgi:hypothetical protein